MESSYKSISVKDFLGKDPTTSELVETIYSMYYCLQELHKKGYYAEDITFDTVTFTQAEGSHKRFDFSSINTTPDNSKFREYCISNIVLLTYTALGMFGYNYSSELQPSNPAYFDYSRMVKQDPYFVYNNYNVISDFIPYGKDYFDDIMTGNYSYFNEYVDYTDKNRKSSRDSNRGSYVKATPAGRGYGEEDNSFAYIKVWFYPIIILCIALIAFVVYILYTH